jgi:hypothetical protein
VPTGPDGALVDNPYIFDDQDEPAVSAKQVNDRADGFARVFQAIYL